MCAFMVSFEGISFVSIIRLVFIVFFFFSSRRRHTRFDCDWSSDVCSSDLFADRGNPQLIAGYYDAGPDQIRAWLESAKGVKGVSGAMFTTWQNKYDDLERDRKSVV